MSKNNLFKLMFVALFAFAAVAFTGCKDDIEDVKAPELSIDPMILNFDQQGGTQTVQLTATCDWEISTTLGNWIDVQPMSGSGDTTLTVTTYENTQGERVVIYFTLYHPEYGAWGKSKNTLTVTQTATGEDVVEEIYYYNDFDKEAAEKTYGSSGTSWPYLDQFEGWKNETGTGAENVEYAFTGMSARNNSNSNGSYSDYDGSGVNNMFFGANAYLTIGNIAVASPHVHLSFGGEKYLTGAESNAFVNDEFAITLSADGTNWSAPINYTAPEGDGRWNLGEADFTLPEGTTTLYIKFAASVASAYRMDDVKLEAGLGGQAITFDGSEQPTPGPGDGKIPEGAVEATVLEFLNAAEDETIYVLTGEVTDTYNTTYGNFTLKDSTGEVLIYGLLTPDGEAQTQYMAAGLKDGDTITVYGLRTSYNESPQMKNATYVSHTSVGGEQPGPGVDPTPGEGPYASDSPFVCTEAATANPAGLGDTTINGEAATGFKIGTSSKTGLFTSTAVGVSGDKYLNFYAVAWRGKTATLYVRVGGTQVGSFELVANDGATGNPPFTALAPDTTDHYSVQLKGLTASSVIEFSTSADYTVEENATSGRAIVFGVKLTDEAVDPEQGGNETPTPTPTPGDVTTIADVLALGQGATISSAVIEATVISNMELNNLTSKKGLYVQDATAGLQFYLAANHELKFGDKVQIDLSGAKIAEYNGAVQISDLTLDKITTLSSGNAVEPKTVTITDFLTNKYEGQYVAIEGVQVAEADLAKSWVMDGSHTSISIEDAKGNSFVIFSSKYASYGTQTVPQGSGTIKGISSISKGVVQLIFAQNSDYAALTGERLEAGQGGGDDDNNDDNTTPTPTPEGVVKATVAEFLAAAEDDTIYELTGEITSVASTEWGNFYLKDATDEVYIYGLCSPSGEQKYWTESGVKVGDTITVQTVRSSYNGTPQGKNAIYVSHVACEVDDDPLDPNATCASIVFSEAGYANAESVDGVNIALDSVVSVVFGQGAANNPPAYYDSGMAVRMYQNGATLDVKANGKTITAIKFTFANNHYYLGADSGELSEEAAVRTWTGEASAVKFTSTGTDKDHRAYVAAIEVYYK